jgi:hypothetical protein
VDRQRALPNRSNFAVGAVAEGAPRLRLPSAPRSIRFKEVRPGMCPCVAGHSVALLPRRSPCVRAALAEFGHTLHPFRPLRA